jgi:hypothetical protein
VVRVGFEPVAALGEPVDREFGDGVAHVRDAALAEFRRRDDDRPRLAAEDLRAVDPDGAGLGLAVRVEDAARDPCGRREADRAGVDVLARPERRPLADAHCAPVGPRDPPDDARRIADVHVERAGLVRAVRVGLTPADEAHHARPVDRDPVVVRDPARDGREARRLRGLRFSLLGRTEVARNGLGAPRAGRAPERRRRGVGLRRGRRRRRAAGRPLARDDSRRRERERHDADRGPVHVRRGRNSGAVSRREAADGAASRRRHVTKLRRNPLPRVPSGC